MTTETTIRSAVPPTASDVIPVIDLTASGNTATTARNTAPISVIPCQNISQILRCGLPWSYSRNECSGLLEIFGNLIRIKGDCGIKIREQKYENEIQYCVDQLI